MEGIIKAMVEEGVSAEQFITFMSNYDIQNPPVIQDILSRLIMRETTSYLASPQKGPLKKLTSFLEMLKSPDYAPARVHL